MLKHNLLIIFRNIKKFKSTFFINLIGLSTGLACALLIYLWVNDELTIDKFHEKDEQLFQVMERQQLSDNILIKYRTSGLLAESLAEEIPEVEYAVSVMHYSWFPKFILSDDGDKKVKAIGQFVGKDFFDVFSYNIIQGDKNHLFSDKNSIVISQELALKLFNTTQDIVGKVISWRLAFLNEQVTISGIFNGTPPNSSEQFDFVLSFEKYKEISPSVIHWGNDGTNAYVVLRKGTNLQYFNNKIAGFIKTKLENTDRYLFIKPYSENYLYSKYENGIQSGGRIEYVKLFSIIAIFILLIACINFMNLSTAKAATKLKEVGIKKAIGASRKSLVYQHLGESTMMAFVSLLLAIVFIEISLPIFNDITGKHLTLNFNISFILSLLGTILLTGLLAGSYPALFLSKFNPTMILKGKTKNSVTELWIRKGLVIFQFILSVIFIISVLVISKQVEFIQTKNLGYNKENILYFEKEGKLVKNSEAFLSEIKKIPGVINASCINHPIVGSYNSTWDISWEGKNPNEEINFEILNVDFGMIETLGIEMKEGRSFSSLFSSDDSKIILNEAAIEIMGIKNPVGKSIKLWGKDYEIIGITKNFHFESLHKNVNPLYISLKPDNTFYIMAKISAGQERMVIDEFRKVYERYNPGFTFDYRFLDEDYQAQHISEQRIAVLSKYFAGLTILIAYLGLFGLASFTAEQRTKEIGVRKVLGARTKSIAFLLSKDYLKLVLIAYIIAVPVAYSLMISWLEGFAYKIDISWWMFAFAGGIALVIALATVSYQAFKAATANPVKSLRYE